VNLLNDYLDRQMLVVGVGNPMRGDDEAGLVLAEKVAEKLDLEYLRCEEVPENYVGRMLDNPADTILLVDAVNMKQAPGEIGLLAPDELADNGISTHNCSVSLLAKVLAGVKDKQMLILAIQPQQIEWGQPMTPLMTEAIDRFVADLSNTSQVDSSDPPT